MTVERQVAARMDSRSGAIFGVANESIRAATVMERFREQRTILVAGFAARRSRQKSVNLSAAFHHSPASDRPAGINTRRKKEIHRRAWWNEVVDVVHDAVLPEERA